MAPSSAAAVILFLVLAGGAPSPALQQQPPVKTFNPLKGTGSIRGRVTAADTGLPVRRATVRLSAGGGPTLVTATDADGAFEFTGLPAARFTLMVQKGGLIQVVARPLPFGRGQTIELAAGQRMDGVVIRVMRGGVLTGRVLDEFGEGEPGALVQVHRIRYMQGVRRLTAMSVQTTNDIGQYRIYGLEAGTYYLSATIRDAARPDPVAARPPEGVTSFAPTFFPGVVAPADARPVTVAAGQEIANLDIALRSVRLLRVSGTVVDSQGRPAAGTAIILNSRRPDGVAIGARSLSEAAADGRFTILGVAPGEYRLDVRSRAALERLGAGEGGVGTPQAESAPEYASVPLDVVDDVEGLVIATSRGHRLSGRLVVEDGQMEPAALQKVRVQTYDVESGLSVAGVMLSAAATLQPDLTFDVRNVIGTRIFRVLGLPGGWALKAVRAAGMDLTDSGVEIRGGDVSDVEVVVTARPPTVTGTVTDSRGKPAANRSIIIFPDDRGRWTGYMNRYVVNITCGEDGTFRTMLPAGTYFAAAGDDVANDEWGSPEYLDTLRAVATKFTLGSGEARTLSLTAK